MAPLNGIGFLRPVRRRLNRLQLQDWYRRL